MSTNANVIVPVNTGSTVNIGRRPGGDRPSRISTSSDARMGAYAPSSTAAVTVTVAPKIGESGFFEPTRKPERTSSGVRNANIAKALVAHGYAPDTNGSVTGRDAVPQSQSYYSPKLSRLG